MEEEVAVDLPLVETLAMLVHHEADPEIVEEEHVMIHRWYDWYVDDVDYDYVDDEDDVDNDYNDEEDGNGDDDSDYNDDHVD